MSIGILIVIVIVGLNAIRLIVQNNTTPSLGVTQGQFTPLVKRPNNVSTQTDDVSKQVNTLTFKDTQAQTMTALRKAVIAYGGATIIEERDDYLYVVFSTSLMRFKDDVEFWLDTPKKEVHFRSASRAGYSDMGLNRKRYEALAEHYRAFQVKDH